MIGSADLGTTRGLDKLARLSRATKLFRKAFKAIVESQVHDVVRQQSLQHYGEVSQMMKELYGTGQEEGLYGGLTTGSEPNIGS